MHSGDLGQQTGMATSIAALGALAGPLISGAINTATGVFEVVGYYAGSTNLLAVILMFVVLNMVDIMTRVIHTPTYYLLLCRL
ncbi:uncharacterized protein EV420DRAFT_1588511 [Desarmillaria tabescens]|uniref:Major facilitator superfamily (MFS) profile domain-containing protein n=1 Tax=Armillaria tabescens TaxID=1929756 RepID=A0AA39MKK1_ARMTA|nr:uncharacterized protein EV420DRAFT_1588511 [Desarmillaria tabescens]KAK0437298.1 hypothetical protein EV420DRAFT_1588511 [Desarmillaria tabescens]